MRIRHYRLYSFTMTPHLINLITRLTNLNADINAAYVRAAIANGGVDVRPYHAKALRVKSIAKKMGVCI